MIWRFIGQSHLELCLNECFFPGLFLARSFFKKDKDICLIECFFQGVSLSEVRYFLISFWAANMFFFQVLQKYSWLPGWKLTTLSRETIISIFVKKKTGNGQSVPCFVTTVPFWLWKFPSLKDLHHYGPRLVYSKLNLGVCGPVSHDKNHPNPSCIKVWYICLHLVWLRKYTVPRRFLCSCKRMPL